MNQIYNIIIIKIWIVFHTSSNWPKANKISMSASPWNWLSWLSHIFTEPYLVNQISLCLGSMVLTMLTWLTSICLELSHQLFPCAVTWKPCLSQPSCERMSWKWCIKLLNIMDFCLDEMSQPQGVDGAILELISPQQLN